MKRLLWLVVAVMTLALGSAVFAQGKAAGSKVTAGTVKSVSGDSVVVTATDGKDMTFAVTPTTKFVGKGLGTKTKEKGGKISAADAVAAGDRVSVTWAESGGAMQASEVRVTAKGTVSPKK